MGLPGSSGVGKTAFAPSGSALADSRFNSTEIHSAGDESPAVQFDSDTPRPSRGGLPASVPLSALATLTLMALTIALIEKLQAATNDPTLIDDQITYKDLEHGTLLIAPKGGVTKGVVLDDPELTVIVGAPDGGFVVQQVVNSSADMAQLLGAADAVHFIYQLGQADPFTTGSTQQRAETRLFFPDQPNIQLVSNPLPLLPPLGDNPNTNTGGPDPVGSNAPPAPVLLTFSIGNDRVLSHDDTGGVQDTDPDNLPGGSPGNPGSDDTVDPFPIILTGIDGFDPEAMTSRAREGTPADPFINITGAVPGNFTVLITVEASADGVASGLSVTGGGSIFLFTETTAEGEQVVVGREGSGSEPNSEGAIAFIVYVTPDGEELWLQESLPIDHGDDGNDFDSVQAILDSVLRVRIELSDGTTTQSQTINIGDNVAFEDDGPVAQDDEVHLIAESEQDFNVAFVLDFSGSITNAQFDEQKSAVLAAGQAIFNGTSGEVSIDIVAFATAAILLGGSPFTTLEAFEAAVSGLDANARGLATGTTNYTAALNETMAHFDPEAGATNLVFFVSDGNPNQQGNVNNPIQAGTATAWNSFVNSGDYDLEVTSIGIGSNIQTGPLQAVDVDGNGAPIMIDGFDDLVQALLAEFAGGEAYGNVLFGSDGVAGGGDDDIFGADGPGHISSLRFDSNRDGVINSSDDPGYFFDGEQVHYGELVYDTNELSFDLEPGTTFTFNFESGDWTYTTSQVIDEQFAEHFEYTITDGDGDQTAPASLTVLPPSDPVALYLETTQHTSTT